MKLIHRQSKGLTAYNIAYTAHFVRLSFGFAETSYMLETLSEIAMIMTDGMNNERGGV